MCDLKEARYGPVTGVRGERRSSSLLSTCGAETVPWQPRHSLVSVHVYRRGVDNAITDPRLTYKIQLAAGFPQSLLSSVRENYHLQARTALS